MVKLCFSILFIHLDQDPRTQMNADQTGSGSLIKTVTLATGVLAAERAARGDLMRARPLLTPAPNRDKIRDEPGVF